MNVKNGLSILMVPAGGWAFEQPLIEGKPLKLEAQGYDELEKLVLDWRLQHLSFIDPVTANLEDVRDDIRVYLCRVSPQNCLDRGLAAGIQTRRQPMGNRTDHVPTIHRLNAWFALIQRSTRLEYASAPVAEARAKICSGCRCNVQWKADMCPPCNAAVLSQSQLTRGSRSVSADIPLGACRLYGHLNEAAVWLEAPPTLDENTRPNVREEDISSRCWLKYPELFSVSETLLPEPTLGDQQGSPDHAQGFPIDQYAAPLPLPPLPTVASNKPGETPTQEFKRTHL